MEKSFPIYSGNESVGTLYITCEGLYVSFFAECSYISDEILRVFTACGEKSFSLGVLMPTGDKLTARKTVSKKSLLEKGIALEKISRAYIASEDVSESKAWSASSEGFIFKSNALIALSKAPGSLFRSDKRQLAVPLDIRKPFPAPSLLCIMTPLFINEKAFLAVGVSQGGNPRKLQV